MDVWLDEYDNTVKDGEEVGHPRQIVIMAVLGGDLVVGGDDGSVTQWET